MLALMGWAGLEHPAAASARPQVGPDDPRLNALAELVTHVGKRDACHQLRTVEQLGWVRGTAGGGGVGL